MPQTMTISPDLKSRESVMAAGGRVQLAVTTDQGVRYVKIEAKRKNEPGADKRYVAVPLDEATHVFVSEKGYGTTSLGTYYPPKGKYPTGRFFQIQNDRVALDQDHLDALEAAVLRINGHPTPGYEITAEDACGLCGRKLTDPKSIERGIGPECAGKPTGSKILHASVFASQQPLPEQPQAEVVDANVKAAYEQQIVGEFSTPQLTLDDLRALRSALSIAICETDGTENDHWLYETFDKYIESVDAEVARRMHKAAFAEREAEQERQAALASM